MYSTACTIQYTHACDGRSKYVQYYCTSHPSARSQQWLRRLTTIVNDQGARKIWVVAPLAAAQGCVNESPPSRAHSWIAGAPPHVVLRRLLPRAAEQQQAPTCGVGQCCAGVPDRAVEHTHPAPSCCSFLFFWCGSCRAPRFLPGDARRPPSLASDGTTGLCRESGGGGGGGAALPAAKVGRLAAGRLAGDVGVRSHPPGGTCEWGWCLLRRHQRGRCGCGSGGGGSSGGCGGGLPPPPSAAGAGYKT